MPSDLTGFSIYNRDTRQMEYQTGALMCNLFLADELNRATSRTQSALLEAMEEGQVTVDGQTHPIPEPFLVIATPEPHRRRGHPAAAGLPDGPVYPVPDHGVSRFFKRRWNCCAGRAGEGFWTRWPARPGTWSWSRCAQAVDQVYIGEAVLDYIVQLTAATRKHPRIARGASPRATLAVASVSRAGGLYGRTGLCAAGGCGPDLGGHGGPPAAALLRPGLRRPGRRGRSLPPCSPPKIR